MSTTAETARTRAGRALTPAELADLTQQVAQEVRDGRHELHADAQERWHVRIRCDEHVDVWLISWTTDQGTQLHDHGGSSGAFTVVEGQLSEAIWAGRAGRLVENVREAGETVVFGERYVHDVRNTDAATAVSVHAYSPPLALMNYYDVDHHDDGRAELVRLASVWTDDPEQPFDEAEARAHLGPAEHDSVDALLESARERIERLTPLEARGRVDAGALIVDIRPAWQRAHDGEVPGSLVVERNHLEWRLHPGSGASLPQAAVDQRWIVLCTEGYTSSLAAASLRSLGIDAADVIGGIRAWREAGLRVVPGPSPIEQIVAS